MVPLKLWQWMVLGFPIAAIAAFLLIAAGTQIHQWGLSWIWAVFTLLLLGWRWLLVQWTRPALVQVESVVAQVAEELEGDSKPLTNSNHTEPLEQVEMALQEVLQASRNEPAIWEDWATFWQRCQELITAIAHIYHPEVKHPSLNISVPQAYTLMRGTIDDLDQWLEKLSPTLNQVTISQMVQAYEVYRKLEPSVRKLWQVWNWAQWLLNPMAAVAKRATQRYTTQANQQLVVNLGQLLKEAALRNLSRRAIALYSGQLATGQLATGQLATGQLATGSLASPLATRSLSDPPKANVPRTQTLREILAQAQPPEGIAQKPVQILLVGRTGAGKSSLINTLFVADKAATDVLPNTDRIQDYHWQAETGETLILWDAPGYEQASQTSVAAKKVTSGKISAENIREELLAHVTQADLLLLVTPALDPALQMDVDFLKQVKAVQADLPAIAIVTQVDRVRPLREWQPPYDWEWGDRPKEIGIREATEYRAQHLAEFCEQVLPLVTSDLKTGRTAWGAEELSLALIEAITPAKQLRLTRFLRNLEARTTAAAKIIDHYSFQMTTTQGLTALLKSPVLNFLSTLTTGSPALAHLLSEQIPVEQLPLAIGKLQMAYELFNLLNPDLPHSPTFDLLSLWPLLLDNASSPDRNATAFGHALVEYWSQNLTPEHLQNRFAFYNREQIPR
jgi:predicted GTPase